MGAWDYNGSTSTQNNKGYDYNGTTNTELAIGYDYNGSTNTEVWRRQVYLFDNGSSGDSGGWTLGYTSQADGSTGGSVGSTIYLYSGNNCGYYARTNNQINYSLYTKLSITFSTAVSGGTDRWFKVKRANGNAWETTYDLYSTSSAISSTTVDIDISSVETTNYLYLTVHSWVTSTPRIQATITKIVLS